MYVHFLRLNNQHWNLTKISHYFLVKSLFHSSTTHKVKCWSLCWAFPLKVDSQLKFNFWRDWSAFGNLTFDLEIQTSSFADSSCHVPRPLLMDKVECWTVTLNVRDTKCKVEEWNMTLRFGKLNVGGDGTPYRRISWAWNAVYWTIRRTRIGSPHCVTKSSFKDLKMQLLPSSESKAHIWRQYKNGSEDSNLTVVSYTKFVLLWNTLTPYVVVMKPVSDLCSLCQLNNTKINQDVNISEQEELNCLSGSEETEFHILKDPAVRPLPVVPLGLDEDRKRYLYKEIRELSRSGTEDQHLSFSLEHWNFAVDMSRQFSLFVTPSGINMLCYVMLLTFSPPSSQRTP